MALSIYLDNLWMLLQNYQFIKQRAYELFITYEYLLAKQTA